MKPQHQDTVSVVRFDPSSEGQKEAFRALNLQWIHAYFQVEPKDLEQVENPGKILAEGGEIFFVIEKGRVLGVCAALLCGGGSYEIAKMAVAESCRGRGLGNLLMQAAIAWIREKGGSEVIILSNTVLRPAIELYRKFGFATVRLGPHPDYRRCNIEMRLRL